MQPLSSVQRFAPQGAVGHRIGMQGIVTLHNPGKSVYISDGKTGFRIDTAMSIIFKPGDRADTVGFPRVSDLELTVEGSICRLDPPRCIFRQLTSICEKPQEPYWMG